MFAAYSKDKTTPLRNKEPQQNTRDSKIISLTK